MGGGVNVVVAVEAVAVANAEVVHILTAADGKQNVALRTDFRLAKKQKTKKTESSLARTCSTNLACVVFNNRNNNKLQNKSTKTKKQISAQRLWVVVPFECQRQSQCQIQCQRQCQCQCKCQCQCQSHASITTTTIIMPARRSTNYNSMLASSPNNRNLRIHQPAKRGNFAKISGIVS